ncbi:hypothetical protein [Neobacillus terrae]|uniref:hypothetical protein n=1 Tax=Neobacillus terrae TaxID=3034837 RepID=UPI0014073CE0|nr:hypothetical protein [Neobacillus terrae]NHM32134.1 hypothetical protein [Neobacillus terrae]
MRLDDKGFLLFKDYDKADNEIIDKYYGGFTLDEVKFFRSLTAKLYKAMETRERK